MATQTKSTFENSGSIEYDITQLVYPSDLLEESDTNRYSGHKVVFFINVNETSKSAITAQKNYKLADIPNNDLKNSSGQKLTDNNKNIPIFGEAKKRLTAAIVLYMPNALTQDTSVVWNEEDLDNTAAMVVGVIAGAAAGGNSGLTKGALGAGSAVARMALKAGGSVAQAITRVTPGNTREEQLFKKVNFRQFSMNYNFAPRSEEEAANVLAIIRMFKHHMLPEYKDRTSFLFLFPSDFNIKYYTGTKENPYLEKNFTCVLNSVSINYAPNGIFTTFANGMPTHIDFTMQFTELSLATKDTTPFDPVVPPGPKTPDKVTYVPGTQVGETQFDANGMFLPGIV